MTRRMADGEPWSRRVQPVVPITGLHADVAVGADRHRGADQAATQNDAALPRLFDRTGHGQAIEDRDGLGLFEPGKRQGTKPEAPVNRGQDEKVNRHQAEQRRWQKEQARSEFRPSKGSVLHS